MVRRHMFSMIFLVLAYASVLQGQYIFPAFVKRLAFDEFGQAAHSFVSQAADVTSSAAKDLLKYATNVRNGIREDFSSSFKAAPSIIKHFGPILGSVIPNEPADALATATAAATAGAAVA